MKLTLTFVLSALIMGSNLLWGQNTPTASSPSSRAAIEGVVMKEPGGEAVKKALIELIAENPAEGGAYTQSLARTVPFASRTSCPDGIICSPSAPDFWKSINTTLAATAAY